MLPDASTLLEGKQRDERKVQQRLPHGFYAALPPPALSLCFAMAISAFVISRCAATMAGQPRVCVCVAPLRCRQG